MLAEAFAAGLVPVALYVDERRAGEFAAMLRPYDANVFSVAEKAMARISGVESPPGVLGVFPVVLHPAAALLEAGEPVAVLAGVADPGNAGTLLRAAEIFGIERAIFAGDAVEPHNPKVVRSTMGAIFRMRLATAQPRELVDAARATGYRIVAAAKDGRPLPQYRFARRSLIAIGSERHGVDGALPEYDEAVAIPHAGFGESLNAAVAGGIIFYAFSQQSERTIQEPSSPKKR